MNTLKLISLQFLLQYMKMNINETIATIRIRIRQNSRLLESYLLEANNVNILYVHLDIQIDIV